MDEFALFFGIGFALTGILIGLFRLIAGEVKLVLPALISIATAYVVLFTRVSHWVLSNLGSVLAHLAGLAWGIAYFVGWIFGTLVALFVFRGRGP